MWISIYLRIWLTTLQLTICFFDSTLIATTYLCYFSLARYTCPNLYLRDGLLSPSERTSDLKTREVPVLRVKYFCVLRSDDFGHDVNGAFGVGVLIFVFYRNVVFRVDLAFGRSDFEELVVFCVSLKRIEFFLHLNSKYKSVTTKSYIANHNLNILFNLLLSNVHGTYSDFYCRIFYVSSPISSDFNVITCMFSMFGSNSSENIFSNFVLSKSEMLSFLLSIMSTYTELIPYVWTCIFYRLLVLIPSSAFSLFWLLSTNCCT